MATRGGETPVLYLQNSGFGNIINPLTSLNQIYEVPTLVLVGWRGEPGVKDEPQHVVMGEVQESMLKACGVDYAILASDP